MGVLRKHNFSEDTAGVAKMVAALSSHLMLEESLCERQATAKAKALAIGLGSSQTGGWSWPEFSASTSKETSLDDVTDEDAELQRDLLSAFEAKDFQCQLSAFSNANHSEGKEFMDAMRDVAMVAQRKVLRKHNFSEDAAGVAKMVAVLSSHLMLEESLCERQAAAKAKALAIGLGSSQTSGWSWPAPSTGPRLKAFNADEAAELQQDLLEAFSSAAFQYKLQSLKE